MQIFIKNTAPLADSVEVIIYEERRDDRDVIKVKVWKNPDGSVTIETEQVQKHGSFSVGVTTKTVTLGKEGYKSRTSLPQADGIVLEGGKKESPIGSIIYQRLSRSLREGGKTHAQETLLHEAEFAYVGGNYAECLTCLDKYDASKEGSNV